MFKSLVKFSLFIWLITSFSLFAECCQSVEVSLGWRRDSLDWNTKDLHSKHICGRAKSDILFKDINSYTLSGQAKWTDTNYYIRFSADYGLTDKGRAHERFKIKSPYLWYPIDLETSDPIKRRSEVYDFNAAVGYPFSFFCCRLSVVPLIGFSFHRQHLRVKQDEDFSCSSDCSYSYSSDCSYSYSPFSACEFFDYYSSSDFFLSSYNPFVCSVYSNPFSHSSSSDPTIASALGLKNPHRTNNYRFTWYGFYLGTDIAYALDSSWTLFSELEVHFLDNCHRKRKSWTGVSFVDDYHKKGWAYGFNGVLGVTYTITDCWYTTLRVDFKWWKADAKHDNLEWKSVGAKLGLGYMF